MIASGKKMMELVRQWIQLFVVVVVVVVITIKIIVVVVVFVVVVVASPLIPIEGKRRQNQTRRPLHRPPWFHQHCLDQRAKANQVNYAASVEIYTSGGGGWWLNGEFLCLFALNLIYSNYYDTVALDWQIFAGPVKHQDIKTKELLLKQTKSSCWI